MLSDTELSSSSKSIVMSSRDNLRRRVGQVLGQSFLFFITALSVLAVLFIFYFIAKDAIPFFRLQGFKEFFFSCNWYPSADSPSFGALAIFWGTGLVTLGAAVVSVPLGVAASVCLSDILPFSLRQFVKPMIELLAAVPSVAYGFFALVMFAPLLQNSGSTILVVLCWLLGVPIVGVGGVIVVDLVAGGRAGMRVRRLFCVGCWLLGVGVLYWLSLLLARVVVVSGTNWFSASLILGIMALPTIVSVSEDALQATGRDLREGSYALGATRAETICKVVIPAAGSGILAGVILGIMRALGETMVVWMASGNAAQLPKPWYNVFSPIRTLTATIAGDMGEADQITGAARFHVLFAMAFCLLLVSFVMNLLSEFFIKKSRKKLGGK